jgi:drug/metabolite transporter (DMT)-like permease
LKPGVRAFHHAQASPWKEASMSTDLGAVAFGLVASCSWGAADFSGGVATRRAPVGSVVVATQAIGLVLFIVLAAALPQPFPSLPDLVWDGAAGVADTVGLLAFYRALAVGRMGIAAPITAVLTAATPTLFGAFFQGLPQPLQLAGFVLAVLAVWLLSRSEATSGHPTGRGLAVLAGLSFGGFLILIDQGAHTTIFWPLAVARTVSLLFLLMSILLRRQQVLPTRTALLPVVVAGLLDAGGSICFVLATHAGRLDVATILSSLYPAITVLLAALILREKVRRLQAIGILLALVASSLISR